MFTELTPQTFNLKREITIFEYERGLLYREGKLERILEAGRYSFWRWEKVHVVRVSIRQMSQVVSGQDILTADNIEVRVSMVAQYAIVDPAAAIQQVEDYTEHLYQELQLTLRDLIAARELDALLQSRNELSQELLTAVKPNAEGYGINLTRVGIRDIVLPRQVRNVLMQEIEADRGGRAELIKARHEVAAARARANTAKILSQNPDVIRMRELDALIELAGKNGNVVLLPNLADVFTASSHSRGSNNGHHNGNNDGSN